MLYADLEIRLASRNTDTIAVELRYRASGSDAEAVLTNGAAVASFDYISLSEISLDLDAYGRRLTEMLFANPSVASAWTKALSAARGAKVPIRVRLALDPTDAQLNALRWETLRDPELPDSLPLVADKNLLFSRFSVSADLRPVTPPARKALRVAAVVANPIDLPRYGFQPLDTISEIDRLREALASFSPSVLARGTSDGPPTLDALMRALSDGVDILVLIAHGSTRDGESVLWLEKDESTVHPVNGAALAARIAALNRRPLLVFLASCRSAGDSSNLTSLTSLAPLLSKAGLPAVVAMQGDISMATVAHLVPAFLRELQRDGQIDRALATSRSTVLDQADWWIPALFLRSRSGRIWAEGTPYEVPAGLRMPYRDLDPFTEEQADLFFGRDALIEEGLETWRGGERRFLAVVGASGSGKSSLAQAGLLPSFRQELQELGVLPEVAIIRPGARPLLALSDELRRRGVSARRDLAQALTETPTLLAEIVGQWAREGETSRTLLLLIDQFEELFTLCKNETERAAFDNALTTLVSAGGDSASVLLTLRSDFYHYSPELALRAIISGQQLLVRAMNSDEMEKAIIAPVHLVAGDGPPAFEPGLVALMVEETGSNSGALPLLQYSMGQLWRAGSLTLVAYRGFGGVRGALEQRAELLYNDPSLSEIDRAAIRQLFLELVQLGEGTEDTRRRVPLAELSFTNCTADQTVALVKRLADARLVTTSEEGERATIAVSHEALVQGWSRLRGWIDQDREALRIERQIGNAALQWEEHQREASYLFSGARLAQAEEWAARAPERAIGRVRKFLETSIAERRRDLLARRRSAVLALATIGLITLVVLVGGLAAWALQQRGIAITAQAQVAQLQQETLSRRLAEAAQNQLVNRPYLALLLAVEAERRAPVFEADSALRAVLRHNLYPLLSLDHYGFVSNAEWNQDGSRILTFGDASGPGDIAQVWEASSGNLLLTLLHDGPVHGAEWNQDESRILTFGSGDSSPGGTVKVWEASSGRLLLTLPHDGFVIGAKWNQDGSRILSFGGGTVKVWDADSANLLLTIPHDNPVGGAKWNQDESRILTFGSGDSSPGDIVQVWEASSGRLLLTLPHDGLISGAEWNQDESRILTLVGSDSFGFNGTVKVWEASSGRLLLTLPHDGLVRGAEWNQDESRILTFAPGSPSLGGTVKVWEASSGSLLLTLLLDSPVDGAEWNQDGSRILTFGDDSSGFGGTVKVWEASSGSLLLTLPHDSPVRGAKWNQDESRILTFGDDSPSLGGTVKVWEASSGSLLLTLPHDSPVRGAEWNQDESRILTFGDDSSRVGGTVRVWELTNPSNKQSPLTLAHDSPVGGAEWNQDGSRILTFSRGSPSLGGSVKVWEASSGSLLLTLAHDSPVGGAEWNQDGSRILTFSGDISSSGGTVWVWEASSGRLLFTLPHDGPVRGAEWNQDGSRLLTFGSDSSSSGGTVRVWEAGSGRLLLTLPHDGPVRGAEWNRDGSRLLTFSGDNPSVGGTVKVWEASSGRLLLTLPHDGPVRGGEWNRDGSRILTFGGDNPSVGGTVKVWEASSGRLLLTFPYDGVVSGAEWNQDGRRILAFGGEGTGFGGTAELREATSGGLLFTLPHDGVVSGAKWNQDGSRILTFGGDASGFNGTVKVWEASSGGLLFTLPHDDVISGAEWNQDESRILIFGDKTTVQLHIVNLGELLIFACHYAPRNLSQAEWRQYLPGEPYTRSCPNLPLEPEVPESLRLP